MIVPLNIDYKIHFFPTLKSTNDHLKSDPFPEGSVIWAESQTHGRGQGQNSWDSQPGGLYFSVLFHPPETCLSSLPLLPPCIAAALLKTLRKKQPGLTLKWPNDIHSSNGKISGILSETQIQGSSIKGMIIGIGINLENKIDPKTLEKAKTQGYGVDHFSLSPSTNRLDLIKEILSEIDRVYLAFKTLNFEFLSRFFIQETGFDQPHHFTLSSGDTLTGSMAKILPDARVLLSQYSSQTPFTITRVEPAGETFF